MGLDTMPTRSDERGKAVAGRGVLEDLSKDQARRAALTCQLIVRASVAVRVPGLLSLALVDAEQMCPCKPAAATG